MVVKIDISHPPSNIRKIIINEIEISKSKFAGNFSDVDYGIDKNSGQVDHNNVVDIILREENNTNVIKQRLKDMLTKSTRDYVAVIDPEEGNKIVILKKDHAEQLGVYHCLHCGISFENQIQLSTHQRIHYFF